VIARGEAAAWTAGPGWGLAQARLRFSFGSGFATDRAPKVILRRELYAKPSI